MFINAWIGSTPTHYKEPTFHFGFLSLWGFKCSPLKRYYWNNINIAGKEESLSLSILMIGNECYWCRKKKWDFLTRFRATVGKKAKNCLGGKWKRYSSSRIHSRSQSPENQELEIRDMLGISYGRNAPDLATEHWIMASSQPAHLHEEGLLKAGQAGLGSGRLGACW